ncbi:E3 ubiquitin-protein ligase RNF123-like isoform X1 [Haliotis rubra]|uniref:E3 ubiquitin-protein ligase RNF123-like isoform X1 n=1 Tax=Haliotis rubra TaxID=36100 RepID=UPI001EE525D4|nr:E3 ubiquitin-protein ligase RNF123-like isoform X1 [Haliotis rubra]
MADSRKSRGLSHVVRQRESADQDPYTHSLLRHVFSDQEKSSEAGAAGVEKAMDLHNLQSYIDLSLCDAVNLQGACAVAHEEESSLDENSGRIGSKEVFFDIYSNVGTLIVEPDRLGVSSLSNFSSMRANTCVYKGKWVYELMLGSKGVMQLGWCTMQCKFSQEEGVGDTQDSYAYDGSRLRKWNVKTQKYGEPWLTGDVISCAIDCDEGTMTFYRNGNCMGQAFSTVRRGPGLAYFPAVSLSISENLRANFGATPLRYPLEGYQPLQDPPKSDLVRAQVLFGYLEKLLPVMIEDDQVIGAEVIQGKGEEALPPLTEHRTRRCTAMLVAAHIFEKLAPLLRSAYIVEGHLLKFLLKFRDCEKHLSEQPYISKLLDLFWALLQDFELKTCLEHLVTTLLSSYRFSPVTSDFRYPKLYLNLTLAILQHGRTRKHLLANVLFDKVKFPIFLHIKPPDDGGLAEMVPIVYWEYQTKEEDDPVPVEPPEVLRKKKDYLASCEQLRKQIEEVEDIQVEMLKVLLIWNDPKDGKTTRDIFMEKLRAFLRENSAYTRVHQIHTCPLPVSLCFYHRLIQALRYYWDLFQKEDTGRFVHSSGAFVPVQEFWVDTREYYDFQRCGGLMSHLNRTLGAEVNKAQGISVSDDGKVVRTEKKSKESAAAVTTEVYPEPEMPSGNSLMKLLDSLIILYHIAAHKQLGKMCALRDNMRDFVFALQDTEEKINRCSTETNDIREDLEQAKKVFLEKITEQSRQMGWVIAVIYSKSKQNDIAWMLRVILTTIEKASKYKQLFQFVPELYIESCINSYNALKNYLHPTTKFDQIEGYDNLLVKYANFLTSHFADSRIVSNDLRDNLVQALACFTCYPRTLEVLESLPWERQASVIKSLIAPYENRSWAHTNWILVRLWKGCGFSFRYRFLPNLVPSKVQPTEFSFVSLQKPCPSYVYQSILAKILLDEEAMSTRFLDTLMNQLNWSFSEFVGIMQEINQLVSHTEHMFLEGRQLKICAACFEISVCLLRVLEMVVSIASQLFTDWSRPSAELFLKRIMQLLSQVMSRITSRNGAFEKLVSLPLPGLDSVTYFPVLTVAVGILIKLLIDTQGERQDKATRALLLDAGFKLSTLDFVLGEIPPEKGKKGKKFSLKTFEEVSKEELENIESLRVYLKHKQNTLESQSQVKVKDEDLCTICYASPRSATFIPCAHQSCRTCITQQLMAKKECFFCKAIITSVKDMHGNTILREQCQGQSKH